MPISPAQASVVAATVPTANSHNPVSSSNIASGSSAASILKANEEAGSRALTSKDANVSKAAVENVVNAANAVLPSALSERIGLQVDERSGQLYVQVIDKTNSKILREFPSKEMRDLQSALANFVGLLVDKVA
jgi:flagellar protein FlaG